MAIDELSPLRAALAGDQEAFERLVAPYRRELLVHCYRFLGALEDAEDMLQETLLRAWRGLNSYAGRASFRAWLYKIATNVCLDGLERRRALPDALLPPGRPGGALPQPVLDPIWLEPLPDSALEGLPSGMGADPEAAYELHESVALAFLSVLQELPGRQRAALILRDVLGFSADETSRMLDLSTPAVNSALQRARATMNGRAVRPAAPPAEGQLADLLARYVRAWEAADAAGLVRLLRDDVVLTMPPLPLWYRGQADVRAFAESFLFAGQAAGRFRLRLAHANACPACVVYERQADGRYTPTALQVLTVTSAGHIAAIHDFLTNDARFFERFGVPASL